MADSGVRARPICPRTTRTDPSPCTSCGATLLALCGRTRGLARQFTTVGGMRERLVAGAATGMPYDLAGAPSKAAGGDHPLLPSASSNTRTPLHYDACRVRSGLHTPQRFWPQSQLGVQRNTNGWRQLTDVPPIYESWIRRAGGRS